jgi:hypothetical protein
VSVRAADRAWITLAAGVVAYEVAASLRGWELLSTAMDRYRGEGLRRDDYAELARRGIDAVIAYLALHLMRRWPRRWDPLSRLTEWLAR